MVSNEFDSVPAFIGSQHVVDELQRCDHLADATRPLSAKNYAGVFDARGCMLKMIVVVRD